MGNQTIMLSKQYNPSKLEFPVMVSEKLDGVAADFYGVGSLTDSRCDVQSRQGKPIPAVAHIVKFLEGRLPLDAHVITELYSHSLPFKDISGAVRRQDEIATGISAYIYDFYIESSPDTPYAARMALASEYLEECIDEYSPVQFIPQALINTREELNEFIAKFTLENPDAEGLVIRNCYGEHSHYKFGRSWGMQKLKPKGDVDLIVAGFEEATSADGRPLGMVGRINLLYNGTLIGAGPGSLTHPERIEIWENPEWYIGKTAEIHYMIDPSYDGLREARFYRWRTDKDDADS